MWSDATAVVKTRASTADAADAAEGATSDLSDATPVQRTPVLVKTRIPWLQQPSLSREQACVGSAAPRRFTAAAGDPQGPAAAQFLGTTLGLEHPPVRQ